MVLLSKKISLFLILLFGVSAYAVDSQDFLFELGYTDSSVSPSDLNTARQTFEWNNTTPGSGSIHNLAGFSGTIGYQFYDGVLFLLQVKQLSQTLAANSVNGASYSVTEAFEYDPIYLLADVPFAAFDWLTLSLRGGFGYAYRFELKQQNNGANNELVVWGAHPIPLQIGGTADYKFLDSAGLYIGIHYEYVKSTLKALANYQTTFSGQPISSGQTYTNVATGSNVTANLSGIYYELGFRFTF